MLFIETLYLTGLYNFLLLWVKRIQHSIANNVTMNSILKDLNLRHTSQPTSLKDYYDIQRKGGPYYYRNGLGLKKKSCRFISRNDL
jgi:hypothetical protein